MEFSNILEVKNAQSFSEITKVVDLIEMGLSPSSAKSFIPNLDKTLNFLRLEYLSKGKTATRPHAINWLKKTHNQYAFNVAYRYYLRIRSDNPYIKKAITASDLYNSFNIFSSLFPELTFNAETEAGLNLDRFLRGLYAIRHHDVIHNDCKKCNASFLKFAGQLSKNCPHCSLFARKNSKLEAITAQ